MQSFKKKYSLMDPKRLYKSFTQSLFERLLCVKYCTSNEAMGIGRQFRPKVGLHMAYNLGG